MRTTTSARRTILAVAVTAAAVFATTLVGAGGAVAADNAAVAAPAPANPKPRTVVTTDMEQDDLASLIHYMFYVNDLDTQGFIYTSGRYHWAGDGRGTKFFLPGREYDTPQTSWRWTGTDTIQDDVFGAYAKVYPNLKRQDPAYPSPADLRSKVRVGNIDFENSMSRDTPGSDLIKSLLLDTDPRPLYLQAWGGTNTIARALKSIEVQYTGTPQWAKIRAKVTAKAVILASGFQDETYADYISKKWPLVKVEQLSAGYATWGYNCNRGNGNTRGLPADRAYFRGPFIRSSIQIGPLGSLYRSWLDGQAMPGDPLDIFGDPAQAAGGWCPPLSRYDFLSEGDNVAFLPLLDTGIDTPADPLLGGWGGRAVQTSSYPNLWTMVPTELDARGAAVADYTTSRWEAAVWRDFANRVQWSLTPRYVDANHAPVVQLATGTTVEVVPGQTIVLRGALSDPDGDDVTAQWWQYREEGTYPGQVAFSSRAEAQTAVTVPRDARAGQTISVILRGDDLPDTGQFALTRYARTTLRVV